MGHFPATQNLIPHEGRGLCLISFQSQLSSQHMRLSTSSGLGLWVLGKRPRGADHLEAEG